MASKARTGTGHGYTKYFLSILELYCTDKMYSVGKMYFFDKNQFYQ